MNQPNAEYIPGILKRVSDAFIALDKDWRFIYINAKAGQLFNRQDTYLIGKNIWAELSKKIDDPFYIACYKAMKDQQNICIEEYYPQHDKWFENHIYPSPDGVSIFFLDITNRKKREEELVQSEKRFRAFVENNDAIITLIDEQQNMLFRNSSAARITGRTNEEYKENTGNQNIHPDDLETVKSVITDAVKRPGIPIPIIFRAKHKNGNYIWLEGVTTNKMNDPDIRAILTNLRDVSQRIEAEQKLQIEITERKKAEQAIKESEEKYRILVEQASDAIFIIDDTGHFITVNTSACKLSQYPEKELLQMSIYDFAITEDIQVNPFRFDELEEGKTVVTERIMKGKNGQITNVEITSKRLSDGRLLVFIRDITERIKASLAIKESEEKYRMLVEQASDAIYITDTDGHIITVNRSACKLSQYSEKELLQMTVYDFLSTEEVQKNPLRIDELKQGKTILVERRLRRKDGVFFRVETTAKMLSDGRILVFARDISERKKAEQALKESEEKYRTLVEQASDGIFIYDRNGRIISASPSSCRLTEYSESELLQMTIYDFVTAEELQIRPFRFEELKKGKTVITERLMVQKSGRQLNVEGMSKMLPNGNILVFMRDITERIKAQNEIIKERNLSDSIINSLPGIFYLIDENGNMLRWNRNLEFISGYSTAEIGRMKPLDFFDDDEKGFLGRKIQQVFTSGTADVEAFYLTKYKTKIPYYFSGWRIMFEGRPCLIGVGIDITEKKEAEERLKKSYEDIRNLASHLSQVREEERKRIGREIHDELGQQLTAIKMDVAWVNKKTPDEITAVKSKLKNITTLLDGSNKAIRRILTELSPAVIDNDGLLEALERQNRQFRTSTGIPLEFITTEINIHLPQDIANCIFRVYQESLTNIMKYAEAYKVITSLNIIGGAIVVTIKDDGKGFDTSAIQTNKSFGILGMKERVLSQNGKFELQSQKGEGTKITVTVPAG